MSLVFALRYAWRNLLRGGERTLLAAACVACGVLSLVGLQLLAGTIGASIALDSRAVLGGDAALSRPGGSLRPADLAQLAALRAEGRIAACSLVAERLAVILQRDGGGRAHFLSRALGVDPATFPLVGEVGLRRAPAADFQRLISSLGAAVLTADVADAMGLAVGDGFTLGGGPQGPPSHLRLVAIAELTPDRQGDTAFYSLATARSLAGLPPGAHGAHGADIADIADSALVLWPPGPPALPALVAAGWTVATPDQLVARRARVANLFGLMLKGAAILGLLLAGIGVSNTLQVLMARRRTEIATLKTLGYQRHHLVLLFGLESALLGVGGGVVGAAAGTGLAVWLRALMGRMGALMLGPLVEPRVLAGGVAVGVATAVLFSLNAIVRASAVRPATLLRDLPPAGDWRESAALALATGTVFSALAAWIMGSVPFGVGVVVAGFAGLALLMGILGGLFFAVVVLPLPWPFSTPVVALARRHLRRQSSRTLTALVALFCGVFTIGFAATAISSGRQRFVAHQLATGGYNLAAYVPQREAAAFAAALADAGVTDVERRVVTPAFVTTLGGAGTALGSVTGWGSDRTGSLKVVAGTWPNAAATALAPLRLRGEPWNLALGDALDVTAPDGGHLRLSIAGFYKDATQAPAATPSLLPRLAGLVVDEPTALRLAGPATQVDFVAQVATERLAAVATQLGRAVPGALVLSRADLNAALQGLLASFFTFVVTLAGLALAAGAVLIANSVGLATLERRREMGIWKAIGYSSARVLAGIAVEYSFLGLVAGVAGMAAVGVAGAVLNRLHPAAQLALDPCQAVVMVLASTAIALASAVVVAWGPTHARPLEVLRQE